MGQSELNVRSVTISSDSKNSAALAAQMLRRVSFERWSRVGAEDLPTELPRIAVQFQVHGNMRSRGGRASACARDLARTILWLVVALWRLFFEILGLILRAILFIWVSFWEPKCGLNRHEDIFGVPWLPHATP